MIEETTDSMFNMFFSDKPTMSKDKCHNSLCVDSLCALMTSETQIIQYDENHSIVLSGISSSKSLKTFDSASAMHDLENADGIKKGQERIPDKGESSNKKFKNYDSDDSGQDRVVVYHYNGKFYSFLSYSIQK